MGHRPVTLIGFTQYRLGRNAFMHRKFIALILMASVLVTGASSSARADGDDLARALAAIAGVAIVGKIISDRRDDDDHVTHAPAPVYGHTPRPPVYGYTPPRTRSNFNYSVHGYPIRRHTTPYPVRPRPSRFDLPGQCLRSFRLNNRPVQLFGARCLRYEYGYKASLPEACKFKFISSGGKQHGYDSACLRQRGYRSARY